VRWWRCADRCGVPAWTRGRTTGNGSSEVPAKERSVKGWSATPLEERRAGDSVYRKGEDGSGAAAVNGRSGDSASCSETQGSFETCAPGERADRMSCHRWPHNRKIGDNGGGLPWRKMSLRGGCGGH
jgi:hypothetical protein